MSEERRAAIRTPEREKEVALETLLGSREPRVGFWGNVPGRTSTAHFWLEVEWQPLPGDDLKVRYESACGRWDLGRYEGVTGGKLGATDKDGVRHVGRYDRETGQTPKKVHDVGEGKRRICKRCAYVVEMEDA